MTRFLDPKFWICPSKQGLGHCHGSESEPSKPVYLYVRVHVAMQCMRQRQGILADQRSIRTIAKVGGLVGKTISIDENSRFNSDFVRIKIACRDINEIPAVAESTLGMFLYDFYFELDDADVEAGYKNKAAVKVDSNFMQPSPKKQ